MFIFTPVSLLFLSYAIFKLFCLLVSPRPRVLIPSYQYSPIPGLRSWIGAIRFMRSPLTFLVSAYEIHKHYQGPMGCFKLSNLYDELIVLCDRKKIAELYAAPSNVLSSFARNKENLQIEWIMGRELSVDPYPIRVIGENSMKGFQGFVEEGGVAEVKRTIEEWVGASSTEWNDVPVYQLSAFAVGRFSNFIFGGEELSRNEQYIEILSEYGRAFITSIQILRLIPGRSFKKARSLLAPYLYHRLFAFSADLPSRQDLLSSLIATTPESQRTVPHLVQALFAVNAAVQATTYLIANALFMLSADPDNLLPELRAEAQQHLPLGTSSTTPQQLNKLEKLDSFLRETARLNNALLVAGERLVMRDFWFSDGTFVPKGSTLAVPQAALHRDGNVYNAPETFLPWRYLSGHNEKKEEGHGDAKKKGNPNPSLHDTNDSDYVHFGHGKHPCPGRHFASLTSKLILVSIILDYDIQRIPGAPLPNRQRYYGVYNIPDMQYKMALRRFDQRVVNDTQS
ncbi:cytochrome P450 [Periconia macrospinosa]|uniref:Cytochrome P450 n=1 Tax=Periconia macrospinosa TaxID=97972 RepID=A0A2V1DJT8_9PLEO|nr:cytochrome P450 [Periconia macrospinosa]